MKKKKKKKFKEMLWLVNECVYQRAERQMDPAFLLRLRRREENYFLTRQSTTSTCAAGKESDDEKDSINHIFIKLTNLLVLLADVQHGLDADIPALDNRIQWRRLLVKHVHGLSEKRSKLFLRHFSNFGRR